jgi:molybdopterin synthase catalytic subunit/molybdopterin converting factor small subunit
MSIHLKLFAAFAEFIGQRDLQIAFASGMTCEGAWRQVKADHPRVAKIPVLFAVNGEYVAAESPLKDGDTLMVFPPLSGGDVGYISDSALSLPEAMEAIKDENGGGEAFFIGRVRRYNEGKVVRFLFYECEISMAEKEIDKIVKEMFQKWPLRKVHVRHRIGKLEIGDVAVIIAVSAEHRREALEACRYGIDEVKHRVPIWKKEVSETGEEWIGACEEEKHEDTKTQS